MNSVTPAVVAIVIIVRFEMYVLRDLAQAEEVRSLTKPAWAAICILSLPFGGILYLMHGRTR
jgi:hypothetical protein